jgi:tetratricopeptide (TPR) repeat protein
MWMIVVYVVGQFMYGEFNEVRIFMQVLPLSCLVLSEYAQGWTRRSAEAAVLPQSGSSPEQPGGRRKSRMRAPKPVTGKNMPVSMESTWGCRKSDGGLVWMAAVVMVISSLVVAWDYYELLRSRVPRYQAHALAELKVKAEQGEASAQYMLGNYYYKKPGMATNWPEAFNWFGEAAGRGHPGAQLKLGLCYLRGEGTAQNYEASIPWFRKVAAPNNREVRCYFDLDYGEGFNAERTLADHFQYLAWLGPLALVGAGLITVVGAVLRRKSFLDPALGIAMVLAVGALSWRWRYGGVETLWQGIIARDPNCYLACKNLGYALLQTGQGDQALTCFQKAMDLEPGDASAYFNIGNVLVKYGRMDEAVVYYQKALELEPDDASAHFNIGNVLFKKGRLEEAVAHFRKAVELSPDNAAAHNNLGYALAKKGQLDEAIRQYHEALRLKPDVAEASNNLVGALGLKEAAAKQPTFSTKP